MPSLCQFLAVPHDHLRALLMQLHVSRDVLPELPTLALQPRSPIAMFPLKALHLLVQHGVGDVRIGVGLLDKALDGLDALRVLPGCGLVLRGEVLVRRVRVPERTDLLPKSAEISDEGRSLFADEPELRLVHLLLFLIDGHDLPLPLSLPPRGSPLQNHLRLIVAPYRLRVRRHQPARRVRRHRPRVRRYRPARRVRRNRSRVRLHRPARATQRTCAATTEALRRRRRPRRPGRRPSSGPACSRRTRRTCRPCWCGCCAGRGGGVRGQVPTTGATMAWRRRCSTRRMSQRMPGSHAT
mmetsp:Transcript_147351/g.471084  ORF Transcript_147351/g.471084 Transcript_147351/m.471084 type:complete len:297 (+) Transcript_147351:2556-3446(+)